MANVGNHLHLQIKLSTLKLKDYVRTNQLEGDGYAREHARMMIEVEKLF